MRRCVKRVRKVLCLNCGENENPTDDNMMEVTDKGLKKCSAPAGRADRDETFQPRKENDFYFK